MFKLLIILISAQVRWADWLLIDKSFTDTQIDSNGWQFTTSCACSNCNENFNKEACASNVNPLEYMKMEKNRERIYKKINYKSFKLQTIFEVYYNNADGHHDSTLFHRYHETSLVQIYRKDYQDSDLVQKSNRICLGGADHEFDQYTVISTQITNYADSFTLVFCFDPDKNDCTVGIRNVLVYANACFPRCETCSGASQNQCSTCYYGTLNSGSCSCDPSHQFAETAIGCRQECARDYYISNNDLICVPDRRIFSKYTYFDSTISTTDSPRYQPFTFIPDPFYYQNIDRIYNNCNGNDFVGEFIYNQGISFQFDTINAMKFFRLRMTLYLFNLQSNSKLMILVDDVVQSEIEKTLTSYQFNNAVNIFTISETCDSKIYSLIRIEAILRTYSQNPLLIIQGSLNDASESWGFRNVTIDVGLCSENCDICSGFFTCSQCATGYILYQNGCVASCPIHSTNCVDYSDELPCIINIYLDSRYLAKGFYDLNMTLDEIDNYYDSFATSSTNFLTGQKFSFFPNKFVLGGVLVWFDATYIKTFSIPKPHYAVSIRFNMTYGDSYPGTFSYAIDSSWSSSYTQPSTGGSNILGQADFEKTSYFHIYKNPHIANTLEIKFKCTKSTGLDIRDAFCAISEYFIVVHYCPPFCTQCSSATVCALPVGYTGSSCASNQYLKFDSSTETYSCNICSITGCTTCISQNECTACTYTSTNKFYLANGQCLCYPFTYLSVSTCVICSRYCENCYGSNSNNCLTCVSEFHRSLQQNSCICEPGYYDDGHNLPCIPICGDQLIVNGEDCDDGNYNPFDGCDQCKFSCDRECNVCGLGVCESCIEGYQLVGNHCFPICHDNLLQAVEECEDNSQGCFNCKYQCSQNCTNCIRGICYKCNEGWYLQLDNSCQPFCGDSSLATYETCDDNNKDPFDGCNQCQSDCGEFCSLCALNQCVQCEIGYYLSPKTNECITICGDGITVFSEICDDNNTLAQDGCYNCNVSCQSECTNCSKNGCQECGIDGWQLNEIHSVCETICGDGIVIPFYEECDDSTINCVACKFKCEESCQQCYQGICQLCKTGWYLNKLDQQCYTISGDSLILGNEQCDDSNTVSNDGCYLSEYSCQQSCDICQLGKCSLCFAGYYNNLGKCIEISNDGITVGSEQCDDSNLIEQDGCFNNQFDCPQNCQSCVKGQCLKCRSGYSYLNHICLPICGDGIVAITEECDDGNTKPYDGCFECYFQCHPQCKQCIKGKCQECNEGYYIDQNQCVSGCGDEIITVDEECDNNLPSTCIKCQFVCHQQCFNCIEGQCYNCYGLGWGLNTVAKDCQPICGDGLVIGNEECDDGNNIQEDGCYECYYQCQNQCTNCIKGICYECHTIGWDITQNQCYPVCGDKIIIQDHEECDDGNIIPYDGCFNCKYQCQEQCTDCKEGVCYACDVKGWKIQNNICNTDCGDQYIVLGYEDCDDGNDVLYDGCYDCQFQCEQMCTNCYLGICYECNNLGWIIENNKCIPFCGDGLIKGYEQCDDMNQDPDDGCHQCKYKCDKYCIDCQDSICMECEQGRYVQQNSCQAQCGDGYYVQYAEQCDDGNDDNQDGCNSHCKIENDWVCQNIGQSSSCFYSQYPEFKLTIITKTPEDVEIVQLTFNQQMKQNVQDTILNHIKADITNLENSGFLITMSLDNQPSTTEVSDITITIKINFYIPVETPKLSVSLFNDPVVSQYNLTLKENTGSIILPTPMVLSGAQKAIADSASQFNQGVIYSLIGLSTLCIMTGSSDLFWNLMDQLQYLSYIKYINIQFPNNLNIYFEVFKLVTISPLISALGIDKIFAALDGSENYFVPTQNKFLKDEINGYFYLNFQSFLFILISGFLGYWGTYYTSKFLQRLGPYYMSKFPFTIAKFICNVKQKFVKQASQFYYNGILRIIMSNCYDTSFSCAIQIANYVGGDNVLVINYYFAVIAFVSQIGFTVYLIGVTSKFNNHSTLRNKEQFDAIFDGVHEDKPIWVMQYNSVMFLKKQIFIYMIVFMQQMGQIQTLSIAFVQTIFLSYLLITKPLTNNYEHYKSIVTELMIIFNTITFLVYAYRIEASLTLAESINLGWVHICTSTLILAVSFLFDLIQQMKVLINKIKQALKEQKKENPHASETLFY